MAEGVADMMGKTKDDRDLEKHVKKYNDTGALKRMERQAKERNRPKEECDMCLTIDITVPQIIPICSKCVEKIAKKEGKMTLIQRKHFLIKKVCDLCEKPRITHYTVALKVCLKCNKKIGEKMNRETSEKWVEKSKELFKEFQDKDKDGR